MSRARSATPGCLSTAEAAERLGISQRRVHALIAAGRLPAKRIAHVWVVNAADLRLVAVRRPGRPRGSRRGGERGGKP